jgi:predicted rRNA methylase
LRAPQVDAILVPPRAWGGTVLYGIEPVAAAVRHGRRELRRLYVRSPAASPRLAALVESARDRDLPVQEASVHQLGNLARTRQHQGVVLDCGPLPLLFLEDFLAAAGPRCLVVALDQVEDPQNLGTIARSCAFLGGDALLVLRARSAPLSPAASKASAGALELLPLVEVPNLAQAITQMQDAGFFVLGASAEDAVDYRQIPPPARCVLVLGNEGQGLRRLSRERCDQLVRIPRRAVTDEPVESLNVGVACGILLAHLGAGRPEEP